MSDYENRPAPEGINYSRENPLKEFFLLLLAAAGALLVLLFALSLAAQKLAPLVPFAMEERLVTRFAEQFPATPDTENAQRIEQYLHSLAVSLLQSQTLPDGLNLKVHYLPSETLNAFATRGGVGQNLRSRRVAGRSMDGYSTTLAAQRCARSRVQIF